MVWWSIMGSLVSYYFEANTRAISDSRLDDETTLEAGILFKLRRYNNGRASGLLRLIYEGATCPYTRRIFIGFTDNRYRYKLRRNSEKGAVETNEEKLKTIPYPRHNVLFAKPLMMTSLCYIYPRAHPLSATPKQEFIHRYREINASRLLGMLVRKNGSTDDCVDTIRQFSQLTKLRIRMEQPFQFSAGYFQKTTLPLQLELNWDFCRLIKVCCGSVSNSLRNDVTQRDVSSADKKKDIMQLKAKRCGSQVRKGLEIFQPLRKPQTAEKTYHHGKEGPFLPQVLARGMIIPPLRVPANLWSCPCN
ncbi:hypothetical protein AVEN_46182-1 [Araneus ventricosus]|uniref:Uncharacterized protein n=1 Tax=Araneus ventricosus TaxID=182803 RepID=A0A4Y2E6Z2_ARAVE|nr:hypothetical protein AVEN_46182-1 [Araneus ventricosus]